MAQELCEGLRIIPHLQWINASGEIIDNMLHLLAHTTLLPRDAIHLASMNACDVTTLISDDGDFDSVKTIKRIPL